MSRGNDGADESDSGVGLLIGDLVTVDQITELSESAVPELGVEKMEIVTRE
jgi:hypothetical protein